MASLNPEQVEDLTREVARLRAQVDEAEALIRYLRDRTLILNHEVRNRDTRIVELEQTAADPAAHVEQANAG